MEEKDFYHTKWVYCLFVQLVKVIPKISYYSLPPIENAILTPEHMPEE